MNAPAPIRVIGGGMTGLTVALRLAQRGLRVVVHERCGTPGGLSGETTLNGIPVELFYHCVLPTDTTLLALLKEIGIEDAVGWRKTRTGFFHDGRMLDLTTAFDFMRFPALRMVDRVRLAWTLVYCELQQNWRELDQEPVSTFLRRHGSERLFKAIWEPLLIAKLGKEYDRFSASYIWATIRRMLDARSAIDHAEHLGYIRGRYGRVFDALVVAIQNTGGEVLTGSEVQRISPSEETEGLWHVQAGARVEKASGIVLCVPSPVAAGMLRDSYPETASTLAGIEYLGVVCEVLLLRRGISPYYVMNLTDRRLPFTGVIEMSNLTGREEFSGNAVVYLPRYIGAESPVWQMTDGEIHEENMEGVRLVAPGLLSEEIVSWQVNRARYVQPVHPRNNLGVVLPVGLAPGLAYVSTAQIHSGPIFNDAVVDNVDCRMPEVLLALNLASEHVAQPESIC